MQAISVGEILWDVIGEKEFLGGAPLNFAANLARLGDEVALVSAVGADERGRRALEQMQKLHLRTDFVGTSKERPTGTAVVQLGANNSVQFVIERPAAFDCLVADEALLSRLAALEPDWIYFGTLAQHQSASEETLRLILAQVPGARHFFDINLRQDHWSLELVERLAPLSTIVKINDEEAELLWRLTTGETAFDLETFCRGWSAKYGTKTLCITLGSKGCAVFQNDRLEAYAGIKVTAVDPVGAGDAFAAAFLHGFAQGWPMEETARFANAAGALVASRAGATPSWDREDIVALMAD